MLSNNFSLLVIKKKIKMYVTLMVRGAPGLHCIVALSRVFTGPIPKPLGMIIYTPKCINVV